MDEQSTDAPAGTATPEPLQELTRGGTAAETVDSPRWEARSVAGEEHGLDVEFEIFENDDLMVQSLLSGSLDYAGGTVAQVASLYEQGMQNIKLVNCHSQTTDYVLVAQSDITSLEQVVEEDRSIGISSSWGATSGLQTVAAFMQEGLIESPDDLNPQRIGFSSARQAAMISGDVDVSPQHYSQWLSMREQGDFNLLLTFGEFLENWVQATDIAPQATIDNYHTELSTFAQAEAQVHRNLYNNGFDYYQDIVTSYVVGGGPDEENLRTTYDFLSELEIWPRNLDLTEDSVDFMLDVVDSIGLTEERVPTDEVMDRTIIESALDEVGRV
jgi:hypothetical protein